MLTLELTQAKSADAGELPLVSLRVRVAKLTRNSFFFAGAAEGSESNHTPFPAIRENPFVR